MKVRISLALIPAILVALAIAMRMAAVGFSADPDYPYLLNGLNILSFYPPGHFDHPGTPLQLLSALVILTSWLFFLPIHGFQDLYASVLSQPDHYLQAINCALVAITAVALFWFGWRIRGATARLMPALVAQISVLIAYPVITGLHSVMTEALLLPATLTLAGFLAPIALRPDSVKETAPYARRLGILLGFTLATKVTALPLLFTIFFLRDKNLQKTAAKTAALSLLALTLPVAVHYPKMAKWFAKLFINSGSYGSGNAGVPSVTTLMETFTGLLIQTPEFFVAIPAYCVALFYLRRSGIRRLIFLSLLMLGFMVLMVLKQPAARYLMPLVAFMALANGALADHIRQRGAWLAGIFLGATLALMLFHNALAGKAWALTENARNRDNLALLATARQSGCRLVLYYSVLDPVYGLAFGNFYASRRWGEILTRIYPAALFYEPYSHQFWTFEKSLSLQELRARLADERCVYFVGSPLDRFADFGISKETLIPVSRTGYGPSASLAVYAWKK